VTKADAQQLAQQLSVQTPQTDRRANYLVAISKKHTARLGGGFLSKIIIYCIDENGCV
jgi:hypothetical protein